MGLTISTGPGTTMPITVAELKDHMKVDTTHDDTLIGYMIGAATEQVQDMLGLQIVQATWDWYLDSFADPRNGSATLRPPRSPVITVAKINYTDAAGNTQTAATTVYAVDTDNMPGRITLKYGQCWPDIYDEADSVLVQFVAGFATSTAVATEVPSNIRAALFMMVDDMYTNRSATRLPVQDNPVVMNLLRPEQVEFV